MRILFVTPYVPSTMRIRPLAFIRELARQGHEVTLACLVQPDWESAYLPEVAPYCRAIHPVRLQRLEPYLRAMASLATRAPLSVGYCRSAELDRLVKGLLSGEFDLLHTEFVRAAPVTLSLNGLPKVFDAVDSLALAYRRSLSVACVPPKQRLIGLLEWLKLRGYEPWVLRHYQRVLVSSPADREVLQVDQVPVDVLPNGVDLDAFSYYTGEHQEATIVFLGKMSYYVNVASVRWFYSQVLPLIRHQRPEVRFKIVGRSPVPAIKALAADPAVEVTGTVPDVRPYLSQATVAICPMVSGAGIQNKMLEAMAVGTPCVATRLACQALQTEAGKDVLVADNPQAFATAVVELLDCPDRRRQISEAGRKYVERFHAWPRIGECLTQVYVDLQRH